MYNDIDFAFTESRIMIAKAYLKASAAIRGDSSAVVYMERWFGIRNTGTSATDKDWWKGAKAIIGAIDSFIRSDISIYYRGNRSLLGQISDYPGDSSIIIPRDIWGFAESVPGVKDNRVGLCEDFFEKNSKHASKVHLKGKDSVGGTLIHELSHNICSTEDHYTHDNLSKDCYGVDDCLELANFRPSRAFYNADNIQYFCEDVYYGIAGVASKRTVTTGATNSVSQIRSRIGGQLPNGFPITHQYWMEKTAKTGHWRSKDLEAVDAAIAQYCSNNNPRNMENLKTKFDHWYNRNPHERTKRNTNNCIGKLRAYLQSR
jgi:hypothetical protein